MDAYTDALISAVKHWGKQVIDRTFDTVYFGGGTPSILGGERLAKILDSVQNEFILASDAEITVECNPDSMTDEVLQSLSGVGGNRLSIGVQSADDTELRMLGRRHTFSEAVAAVDRARQYGFENLSLDLMYGLPEQTDDRFLASVEAVLALNPTHLSCYGLKLEPNTPMGQENPVLPDEDEQADLYLHLCERLRQAGMEHYEISNWSLPDKRSRHNSKYWDLTPYLGIGPGAHSFWDGKRFAYPRSTAAFLAGEQPIEEETVESFPAWAEYLMLGLRTADGVQRERFETLFQKSFAPYDKRLEQLATGGLTHQLPTGWRLTEQGFLVSNSIIQYVLNL